MLNYKNEPSCRTHNLSRLFTRISLNQLKPLHNTPKGLKPSQDVDTTKPFYEIQLHDVTQDVSNSVQYIMESFKRLSDGNQSGIIYKNEHGFKCVFFTH